jgi:hypothetical protein
MTPPSTSQRLLIRLRAHKLLPPGVFAECRKNEDRGSDLKWQVVTSGDKSPLHMGGRDLMEVTCAVRDWDVTVEGNFVYIDPRPGSPLMWRPKNRSLHERYESESSSSQPPPYVQSDDDDEDQPYYEADPAGG